MKRFILFLLLILFVGCSVRPPLEAVNFTKAEINKTDVKEHVPVILRDEVLPTRKVMQTGKLGTVEYGLTDDNKLVHIKKTGAVWKFNYENNRLVEITGPKNIEFLYKQDKVDAVDFGASKVQFEYDSHGKLVSLTGEQYPVYIDYDSKNRVRSIRRGISGKTDVDYDKNERITAITRGPKVMNVYYDEKNRTRAFDGDDTKFILGYWKDDKLISLTGKTFGLGLTVSYGPGLPPTEALIVNQDDDSRFEAAYTDTVYSLVDTYLYCKYLRRLKSVSFEGQSYAFFVNYFDSRIDDYFMMNYVCIPFE